jgi:uncharacterized membrane protein
MKNIETTTLQDILRITLGIFMIFAAIGHMAFLRREFQAQVPDWVPLNKDFVVVASGVVELILGLAIIFLTGLEIWVGIALAIFYVLVFPGNIAQYVNHTNAFNLNSDTARLIRLFFQPVLILWALWCTGALAYLLRR